MLTRLPAFWILNVLMAGCSFGPTPASLSDQLEPSGPCWEVDLSDGLNEDRLDEFHQLFECLNRTGNLDSFAELDQVADEADRHGAPLGLTLIRMSNALPASSFDVLSIVGKALVAIQEHRDDFIVLMETLVEVIYAHPYAKVSEDFDLDDPQALEDGLATPMLQLASGLSTLMLDAGPGFRETVASSIDEQIAQSAVCTLAGVVHSEDPSIESLSTELIPHIAEAWTLAGDTSNDLWDHGTGNSIRDLVEVARIQVDEGAFENIKPSLVTLLSDPRVQESTKQVLHDTAESGHLEGLAEQVLYLSNVDVLGRPLTEPMAYDVSALQAGVRLINRANRPLSCDFLVYEFTLDNMAVTILQELAQLETEQVENSLDFLVGILDGDIGPAILETAANNGLCSGFTPDLLDDLKVLERLNDPAVGNLVEVIHGLLDAVYLDGRIDRVYELVQVLDALHIEGFVPPVEEVLRDLATSDIVHDMTIILPTVIDPSVLHVDSCPTESAPLTYDQLWEAGKLAITEGDTSDESMGLIVDYVLDSEHLWTILERGSALALESESHIHDLPSLMVDVLTSDEAAENSAMVLDTIDDPELWDSALTLLESEAIRDAILQPTDEVQGPLPFMAHLIVSDTVTVMLQTLDLVLDTLGANESENP
jgi:hypothetical protein